MEGRKDDQGKAPLHRLPRAFLEQLARALPADAAERAALRLDLIPPEAIIALASVLAYGANKYGERNWEKGMAWSRPFDAGERHGLAWWDGEAADPETGMSHLWHRICNDAFLIAFEARGASQDDRRASLAASAL
jgi:hypothetical protein